MDNYIIKHYDVGDDIETVVARVYYFLKNPMIIKLPLQHGLC